VVESHGRWRTVGGSDIVMRHAGMLPGNSSIGSGCSSSTSAAEGPYLTWPGPREEHEHSQHGPLGPPPPNPAAASRRRKPRLIPAHHRLGGRPSCRDLQSADQPVRLAATEPVRRCRRLPDAKRGRRTSRHHAVDARHPDQPPGTRYRRAFARTRRTWTAHETDSAR
jgi:hypothetical protein